MIRKLLFTAVTLLLSAQSFAVADYAHSDRKLEELGLTPVLGAEAGTSLLPQLQWSKKKTETQLEVEPEDYVDMAKVVIIVDKAEKGTSDTAQTLSLYLAGEKLYTFPVSTGKETKVWSSSGKRYRATTPIGFFRPTTIFKEYYSYTWAGAPMPNAVFFSGGTALHATTPNHFAEIGERDSGGCVRMMPEAAKIVNETILSTGLPIWRLEDQPIKVKSKILFMTIKKFEVIRKQVIGNTIPVAKVDRFSGELLEETTDSVDAIIVITDRSK